MREITKVQRVLFMQSLDVEILHERQNGSADSTELILALPSWLPQCEMTILIYWDLQLYKKDLQERPIVLSL